MIDFVIFTYESAFTKRDVEKRANRTYGKNPRGGVNQIKWRNSEKIDGQLKILTNMTHLKG